MKFTLSWLKDHLQFDSELKDVSEKLTALGLEVESISDVGDTLSPFIVGHVEDAIKHPNADRLKLCKVNTGSEVIQVICGAPNVRKGIKGVFAHAGTIIPGTGTVLKSSKIRGVQSDGMLCSEREMGLSDEHEGIIELPEDAPLGSSFSKLLGLNDPLIEIAITPNRGDCLGVSGIARDLAASGLGNICSPRIEKTNGSFKNPIDIHLALPESETNACPLFLSRYIRGLRNTKSPQWLQNRLQAIGLRPISAIVDMTNYLTFDQNRPVHAYDADKIAGNNLKISLGRGGLELKALNEKMYVLDDEMTAIEDEAGVVSLAGIMGGERTGCNDETVNVLLEVALFDPVRTAATGRKLAIDSDARYRFERGLDPEFAMVGLDQATQMLLDFCGGEASHVSVSGSIPSWKREISFSPGKIFSLGGVDLDVKESKKILNDLGFDYTNDKRGIIVIPPSWRNDIKGEVDLVEEVLRVYGYDNIPALSLPKPRVRLGSTLTLSGRRASKARRALANHGLMEVVTYSFVGKDLANMFGGNEEQLKITNPISEDLDLMRPSILPNLVQALSRNADRGYSDLGFFEIGPQFEGDSPEEQRLVASGIRAGNMNLRQWHREPRKVDIFDAKSDALTALGAIGAPVKNLQIASECPDWYHPGRSGEFRLGGSIMGWFGEIHPRIVSALDLQSPIVGFECFLDSMPAPKKNRKKTRPALKASDLQSVERDFSFIIENRIRADEVIRAARTAEKKLISEIQVFDIYSGKGITDGYKSIGITIRLQPTEQTLVDSEIDKIAEKIVDNVYKKTGGTIRS